MRKNVRRVFVTAGLLILVFGFAVWWAWNIFSVTVINYSDQTLSDVQAILGGKVLNMGSLAPHAYRTVYGTTGRGEAEFFDEYGAISFQAAGRNTATKRFT